MEDVRLRRCNAQRPFMLNYAYVAIGSAVGGVARFAIGEWLQRRLGDSLPRSGALAFPIGTMLVNVTGSFVLGVVLMVAARMGSEGNMLRLLLAVGLCGGYTTFSTFSAETLALIEQGSLGLAAVNVAASVALAVVGVAAGAMLARAAMGVPS